MYQHVPSNREKSYYKCQNNVHVSRPSMAENADNSLFSLAAVMNAILNFLYLPRHEVGVAGNVLMLGMVSAF